MSESGKSESQTRCPRSHATSRSKLTYFWLKWSFAIGGLASLVWFLVRVIPKPSRAAYPCQRAAAPLASGFVVWLLGVIASAVAAKKARQYLYRSRYVIAGLCILASVAAL